MRHEGVRAGTATFGLIMLAATRVATAESPGQSATAPIVATAPVERSPYLHLFGSLEVGRGIRFNNPYRLATVLGNDAESLSLTATYADLAAGVAFGPPDGLEQGGVLHLSVALDGIAQSVFSPSYVVLLPLRPRAMLHARCGIPFVINPDFSAGGEIAVGGAFMLTAVVGVGGELVGSLFYGAATEDHRATAIPIMSLQLGLVFDYEVLP